MYIEAYIKSCDVGCACRYFLEITAWRVSLGIIGANDVARLLFSPDVTLSPPLGGCRNANPHLELWVTTRVPHNGENTLRQIIIDPI